jgi:hypothetical protein
MSDETEALARLIQSMMSPILSSSVGNGVRLGRIEGELRGINSRLDANDSRLECGSSRMQDQGKEIGLQKGELIHLQDQIENVDKAAREGLKRHSEALRALGAKAEDSEVYVIQQNTIDQTRKKMFSTSTKIIAIVLSLAGVFGAGKYIERCSSGSTHSRNPDAGAKK